MADLVSFLSPLAVARAAAMILSISAASAAYNELSRRIHVTLAGDDHFQQ